MAYVGPFTLLIPAGVKQNSSDVFAILDPDSGGAATFSVPLSANGQAPATYFGARTWLEEATADALMNMTTQQFLTYVKGLAAQRGRAQVASATAFKNALLMDNTMGFWEYIASQGLQQVVQPF